MRMTSCSVVALCLALIAASASAESLSATAFRYSGGQLGYLARNQVYSAWVPSGPAVHKPGMKVMFFGRAEGCNLLASNGPVKNEGNPRFGQALRLTGIPLALDGKGQRWAPSGDTEQCDKSVRQEVGDSFVHVSEDPANSGIGIFTFTGPDQNGRHSFFQQYDRSGKHGMRINANIQGTFAVFVFDWQKRNSVFPWAHGGVAPDQRLAEFRTTQSVVTVSVEDAASAQSGEPIQAKQQLIVAFINRNCIRSRESIERKCQLQYVFNVAVFRAGVKNWDGVKWFKNAGIWMDLGQGGIPIVRAPLGLDGVTSIEGSSGLELYTSRGEPSQHDIFKDKSFVVQMSFAQFKNALRSIAARQLKKKIHEMTTTDLINAFGTHWDDPDEWTLTSVNVSQEVYNPFRDVRSYIGGNIREIAIGSLLLQ